MSGKRGKASSSPPQTNVSLCQITEAWLITHLTLWLCFSPSLPPNGGNARHLTAVVSHSCPETVCCYIAAFLVSLQWRWLVIMILVCAFTWRTSLSLCHSSCRHIGLIFSVHISLFYVNVPPKWHPSTDVVSPAAWVLLTLEFSFCLLLPPPSGFMFLCELLSTAVAQACVCFCAHDKGWPCFAQLWGRWHHCGKLCLLYVIFEWLNTPIFARPLWAERTYCHWVLDNILMAWVKLSKKDHHIITGI